MTVFFDLVRVYCTTFGTAGPLALGGAVTFTGGAKAFRSFADAGIPDGAALSWAIEDLSLPGREAGTGTYSASAGTLTRNTMSSTNGNSPLNLSGLAQLYVTALAADLTNAGNFSSGTVPVTCGGTGAGSFTAHGVLLGEGASAFGLATTGTAGQLLIDQGGGNDPVFSAMSGDATITKGGAITVAKASGAAFAVTTAAARTTTSPITGTGLSIVGADNTFSFLSVDAYGTGSGGYAAMVGRSAGGTYASPAATPGGKNLVTFGGHGFDTAWEANTCCEVQLTSGTNTHSATDHGSRIKFWTTPDASATIGLAGTIYGSGGWGVGGATDPGAGAIALTGDLVLQGNATGVSFAGTAGLFGIGEAVSVAANGVAAMTLSSGLVFLRDMSVGGWSLVAFDGGGDATIIAGTSNFVTSDPGASASKWWIKSNGNVENRYAGAESISYVLLATSGGALA